MTLEQCKKLKAWGLPQIIKCGDLYYDTELKWGIVNVDDGPEDLEPDSILIPDLEQLLEFANKLLQEKFDEAGFLQLTAPNNVQDYYSIVGIGAPKTYNRTSDPDPKQAIYKLIEKIMADQNEVVNA